MTREVMWMVLNELKRFGRGEGGGLSLTILVEALREALAQPVQPASWQPIDAAPKDGSEIILMRGERVTAGHYADEVEVLSSEYHNSGVYLGQYPNGEVREAAWLSWDGGFTAGNPPTHWQHLPRATAIAQPVEPASKVVTP